jgi:GDP-4-dehydro-6-deoxy-D-mannose reductase
MHLLITGIHGFVGRHLGRCALAEGHRVTGTFLEGEGPEGEGLEGIHLVPADIRDRDRVAAVIADANPDAVAHLAGFSSVGASWKDPGETFRVNVLGTEHVLAAAAGRRVLLASSAEVYGLVPEEEQPISEDRTVDPRSPYALTKAAAERLALAAGAVVVRSFNAVGPGQAPTFALPTFAAQLAAMAAGAQEPVLKVGNLSARRDFLHVVDAARAYLLLAEEGVPGTAYNLALGTAESIQDVLNRLIAVAGVEARVETEPERMRPVDIPLLLGDATRLRELGWEPRKSLEEAVRELWEAVR